MDTFSGFYATLQLQIFFCFFLIKVENVTFAFLAMGGGGPRVE